jgi:molybdopterin synthase catalytic subunit
VSADGFFVEGEIPVQSLEEELRRDDGRVVVTLQSVVRLDREGEEELARVVFESEVSRAEDELLTIRRDVSERWRGTLLLRQRLGSVPVGETSTFIAVTAQRREDALAACHNVLDRLRRLPGLRRRDVFRSGLSRLSHTPHETILLSDDAFTLPQS